MHEQIINQNQDVVDSKKRGPSHKLSYKTKLEILQDFVQWKANVPKVNDKSQTFHEFLFKISSEQNSKITTIKSLIASYEKNNNLLTQLEIICSNNSKAGKSGQFMKRESVLSYPIEIDRQLADWLYCSVELGYILTRQCVKEKALELIQPCNQSFKASDCWLDCFLSRYHFSLRALNEKPKHQLDHLATVSAKLKQIVKEQIKAHNIQESMVINMDESPIFWEYLPRKIIAPMLSKSAFGWKRGYHNVRSTLILAVTASGTMLRPSLILKRKSSYHLQCDNDINLNIMNSKNGWSNSKLTIEWLQRVLLPYVNRNQCMLIWDSFEGHISDEVIKFLSNHPNIHVAVIAGGATSKDQPLDISINKQFKTICKRESILQTNSLLSYLEKCNAIQNTLPQISEKTIQSNHLL